MKATENQITTFVGALAKLTPFAVTEAEARPKIAATIRALVLDGLTPEHFNPRRIPAIAATIPKWPSYREIREAVMTQHDQAALPAPGGIDPITKSKMDWWVLGKPWFNCYGPPPDDPDSKIPLDVVRQYSPSAAAKREREAAKWAEHRRKQKAGELPDLDIAAMMRRATEKHGQEDLA